MGAKIALHLAIVGHCGDPSGGAHSDEVGRGFRAKAAACTD
jgi:hypothetical protein